MPALPSSLRFDEYQFQHRAFPVSAETGISFSDYSTMHVETHRGGARWKEGREWANNDVLVRRVLVAALEKRAYVPRPHGTDAQRLARAKKRLIQVVVPKLKRKLAEMCKHYANARAIGIEADALVKLKRQIQTLDGQLKTADRIDSIMVGIIYDFYHRHHECDVVAEKFGLKPSGVRKIVFQLDAIAAEIQKRDADVQEWSRLRAGGATYQAIAEKFSVKWWDVYNELRDTGLYRAGQGPHPERRKKGRLKGKDAEIVAAYQAGESVAQLGERYDVTPWSICLCLRRNGVQRRKRGPVRILMFRGPETVVTVRQRNASQDTVSEHNATTTAQNR